VLARYGKIIDLRHGSLPNLHLAVAGCLFAIANRRAVEATRRQTGSTARLGAKEVATKRSGRILSPVADGRAFVPIVERLTEVFVRGHLYLGLVFCDEHAEPLAAEESVKRLPPRGALHWMGFYGLTPEGFHVMQPSRRALVAYPVALIAAADAGCGIEVSREGHELSRDPENPMLMQLRGPVFLPPVHSIFER
jgi:hypothetical protein